jgi:LTXXQ motif family protein
MTKTEKIVAILSISFLVIVISGFGFVMISRACGVDLFQGSSFHKRSNFHKRGMPPFIQKEIGNFILWRMDKGFESLEMSDGQQDQYDKFRSRLEKTIETGVETRMGFKKQAMLEFEKENPDLSVMAMEIKSHVEMMSTALSQNLNLFADFYNTLDSDQKKKITETIKEKMEDHKKF